MAHDITFQNVDNEAEEIYFFGYLEGIFYQEFEVPHFNLGLSGSNQSIEKTRSAVLSTLERIGESEPVKRYPDTNRFPEFFIKIQESTAQRFKITFS